MGGLQESTQDLVTQWFGQEARSHIAPVTNCTIDSPQLSFRKSFGTWHHQAFDHRALAC
jgi:hypothetical protein